MGEGETAALTQNGNGSTSPENGCDNDGLIVAPIQVIIPVDLSDAEDDSDVEEVKPKKKMQKKKKKAEKKKVDPSEVIVRTFGQALRLINEQKQREKHRLKQEEIRNMALEQKARQEQAGRGTAPVIIHI